MKITLIVGIFLQLILFNSCGQDKITKALEKNVSKLADVNYGVQNIDTLKKLNISLNPFDERRKIKPIYNIFYFENDTLKFCFAAAFQEDFFSINGYIDNNRLELMLDFSSCYEMSSDVIFKVKRIDFKKEKIRVNEPVQAYIDFKGTFLVFYEDTITFDYSGYIETNVTDKVPQF